MDAVKPDVMQNQIELEALRDIVKAARYTSKENMITLVIILTSLLFHFVFTIALHILR